MIIMVKSMLAGRHDADEVAESAYLIFKLQAKGRLS